MLVFQVETQSDCFYLVHKRETLHVGDVDIFLGKRVTCNNVHARRNKDSVNFITIKYIFCVSEFPIYCIRLSRVINEIARDK